MKIKTQDGKYFSQLGSWKGLVEVIIFVLILKIFGYTLLGVLIAIVVAIIMLFVNHKIFDKKKDII